jgi:hypothetical protein
MASQHEIRLAGAAVKGLRISGPLLSELLGVLVEGCERVVRYRLEGRSKAKGISPSWLKPAAEFRFVQTAESGVLRLEADPLEQALPDRFRQRELFEVVDPHQSALDLFEDGLEDALGGKLDSERFDEGLVQTFARLRPLFGQGLDTLAVVNGRTVPVAADGLARIEEMHRRTPKPHQAKVAGELDAIRYSDKMFTLVLPGGERIRGVAEGIDARDLSAFWGKRVVASGLAVFRPSGALARVDADRIETATERDLALWASAPEPLGAPLDSRSLSRPQGPRSGLNAIIGKWPGDETDQEIAAALESMS